MNGDEPTAEKSKFPSNDDLYKGILEETCITEFFLQVKFLVFFPLCLFFAPHKHVSDCKDVFETLIQIIVKHGSPSTGKPRLEISKRSFSYVGAKVWNDIPNAIRNAESTHLFKHKTKTHLLGQSIQK